MKYRIMAYIQVDSEINVLYDSKEEAIQELDHLSHLQPENRYEIEPVQEEVLEGEIEETESYTKYLDQLKKRKKK
jgi:hypothetical protein